MLIDSILIRKAEPEDMEWVNARYREMDFAPSKFENEIVLIAEVKGEKAGLGRLVPVDQRSLELGGMYVLANYRNRGIAREIVNELIKIRDPKKNLYCIPYLHLVGYYESFGFQKVRKMTLLDNNILSRYFWCKENYSLDVSLLVLA